MIATSAIDWQQKLAPLLPRTVVIDADWEEEILVGVFLGERGTGGHSVMVERVSAEGDKLVVGVRVTEPADVEGVVTGITSPYQIVRVGRAQMPDSDPSEMSGVFVELGGR